MFEDEAAQERLYTLCANTIADVGREREALFLVRLVLLLMEQLGDEQACIDAVRSAASELPPPVPSTVGGDAWGTGT